MLYNIWKPSYEHIKVRKLIERVIDNYIVKCKTISNESDRRSLSSPTVFPEFPGR